MSKQIAFQASNQPQNQTLRQGQVEATDQSPRQAQTRQEKMQAQAKKDLVYGLYDTPPFAESLYAGLQHLLAIIISIGTPPLIVAGTMGADAATIGYLVNMSLLISGVATFIQCYKFGPVGSGLLSIQGTSFAFLASLITLSAGLLARGYSIHEALGILFGCSLAGSVVLMVGSRCVVHIQKVISPLVSGIIVTLIGSSLMGVSLQDIGGGASLYNQMAAGGFSATPAGSFGDPLFLLIGFSVTTIVVLANRSKNKFMRIGSVIVGIVSGCIIAGVVGYFSDNISFMGFSEIWAGIRAAPLVTVPIPFKFGIGFDFATFVPIAFLYVMTLVEAYGDLTATAMVSGEPIEGNLYTKRVAGGILGSGVNSALAAVFTCFPNTTFSQNNGVISITGVASRRVGMFVGGLLVFFGLFPAVGSLFTAIPNSVIGGATVIMFGSVMVSGIRIIATNVINRRGILIMAISLGLGFGVMVVPELWNHVPTTGVLYILLSNPITIGGSVAILLNVMLPKNLGEISADSLEDPMQHMAER